MVLITGASGFLGQYLVRYLSAKGEQVRALYHSNPPAGDLLNLQGVSWLQCDLLDVTAVEEAMAGIKGIYHCAAIVSYNPKDREAMLHFNVESTANLVNIALEKSVEKMVHVSSIATLTTGGKPDKMISEENEWDDHEYTSAYGRSKYYAEMEVWRGIGEGLNATIINPGIILGAGDWSKGTPQLMQLAYQQFPFYSAGATAWVDVEDVVKVMHLLMSSAEGEERYIVSSGNYSYKEVLGMMAEALHKKAPRIRASGAMTGMIWRWGALKQRLAGGEALITKETARTATVKSVFDNSKLLRTFPGFSYQDIQNTITKMAVKYMTTIKN